MEKILHIIGAGLAGSEAAWQAAKRGIKVKLFEQKPHKFSPAHKSTNYAELVCSNSLRSDDFEHNAVGLMHEEMRRFDSLIMRAADACKVPAGGALAVDREGFSAFVTHELQQNPNIEIIDREITSFPEPNAPLTIIATGPLTGGALLEAILQKVNRQSLSFYDAIAPVVYKESIDFSKAWYQSRYDKGDKFDYIYTCGPTPMMKAVAEYAKKSGTPCEVSLENRMACGLGACLCCVTDTKHGHECVCQKGPVFDINDLNW